MRKSIIIFSLAQMLLSAPLMAGDYTRYVNPFIGTGPVDNSLSGNCYPGATMPFGMVQLSPDTQDAPDWDNASGYNYNHTTLYGFSHTRLSGTGAADLMDLLFLPVVDDSTEKPVAHFSHQREEARPGYYSVVIDDSNIRAELSATKRVGVHRYTFANQGLHRLYVDLNHSAPKGSWDRRIIQSQLRLVSPQVVEGYRVITGWAKLRRVYFHIEFSRPVVGHLLIDGDRKENNAELINGKELRAFFDFDANEGSELICKVGLSTTSTEAAAANMQAEARSWRFEDYTEMADREWDSILGRIDAEGDDETKQIFYTGLYHAFIQPNVVSDVDGSYTATDYTTRRMPQNKHYYTTFSLWDTFRAIHPLYTLIAPMENKAFCESMLEHFDTYGYLPIWDLWGQDNYCMIGNHAIPVLVDAWLKGTLGDIDGKRVLDAVVASASMSHPGLNVEAWEQYGYMPENVLSQSVSITLEQAFDDWCVALLASRLGDTATAERFSRRATFWKNLYNKDNGFFQARNTDGNWVMPFDPLKYGANGGNPYTEGNPWQWAWYVPHDVDGLIAMNGGAKEFVKKLDTFFTLEGQSGELNSNASGFVGQYVHGNEPSHHVAYLYTLAGKPEKTQHYVSHIMKTMYNTSSNGYAGNDDCGEMSSWYVFSAMGFYPVNPANGEFVLGCPALKSATLHLDNGNSFTMKSNRKDATQERVRTVKLNGKVLKGSIITYEQIFQGGNLEFIF